MDSQGQDPIGVYFGGEVAGVQINGLLKLGRVTALAQAVKCPDVQPDCLVLQGNRFYINGQPRLTNCFLEAIEEIGQPASGAIWGVVRPEQVGQMFAGVGCLSMQAKIGQQVLGVAGRQGETAVFVFQPYAAEQPDAECGLFVIHHKVMITIGVNNGYLNENLIEGWWMNQDPGLQAEAWEASLLSGQPRLRP